MAKKFNKNNRQEREVKEFEEEVLQIDRVTRVVKGGRRLRFRCLVAIGDKKGRVGVGVGKATEVVNGIKKAVSKAKQSLITIPITDSDSIPHEVHIKHKAARMLIMPASPGTGVIAGGALRKILGLAGVKNVLSKSHGTNNKLVTAQAAIMALESLRPVKKGREQKKEQKVEKVQPEKTEVKESHPSKKDSGAKTHSKPKESIKK